MKFLTVVCASFAIICALPGGLAGAIFYRADAPILTQYHSQGELGEYSYGYNAGLSGKVETKSIDDVTRGSYSYLDSNGLVQTVEYTADASNGFRVAASNLPKAPIDLAIAPESVKDTPEVVQARANHMAAFNKEASRMQTQDDTVETMAFRVAASNLPKALIDLAIAPEPVKDTPEVVQARANHMAAFNKEASRMQTQDDTVETMAAPIATPIAQIARIDPINAGYIAVTPAEYPRNSFSYQFSSPVYTYTTGNAFYANAPYYTFGAPIIRASPLEIRPAPLEIRPAPLEIRSAPLELRTPLDTPEVALARAEHLAAVEEEKARIAAARN